MRNTTPALRQARQQLIEHGVTSPGAVAERLAQSWQRSIAAGLMPQGRLTAPEHASSSELRHTLTRNHELLAHSRPVMEYLFEQVQSQQRVVVLADSRGTLMHTLGDPFFLNRAERVALATGASWREDQRGTNAIGTAIVEQAAVEIHGAEHFLERNGFLTCTAAPILSSCGKLLGILDISGDQHSGHPLTLGLVNTAARMIENRLQIASSRRNIRLHLHAHAEGIGTVAEGILSLSEDGWIVGANRAGLQLLGMGAKGIGATQLSSMIDANLEDLLVRNRRRPGQAIQVQTHDHNKLLVQVYAEHLVLPLPSRATGNERVEVVASDALASLDTGDLKWRAAAEKVRRVVDKAIPVLIQGESGVGKEYFARATHESSKRRGAPFIAINCASIPESLVEAELFGYAAGAFTGAKKDGSLGRIREANGGTLFLDEIGDMPLAMQTRLLRVLQERSVTPLGGGRSVDVDFNLICATHCNLREELDAGRFRSDLYYRINGLTVFLPTLRERSDFCSLVDHLLATINRDREVGIAPKLFVKMQNHSWPGNLRQLASVLRTGSAMLNDDECCIELHHLPDDIQEELLAAREPFQTPSVKPEPGNLRELSKYAIDRALENSRGNISLAARTLGISRQTLYRKLNR